MADARVLVVDDEQPLAELVARYLTRDGFDTTVVLDGPAALAAARAQSPDVVVLDLGSPAPTGSRCAGSCAPSPTAM